MKKFLAVSMFFGLVSMSQAAVINVTCTPNPTGAFGASGSNIIETCNTTSLIGQTILGIQIDYSFTALQNSAQQGTITAGTYSFDAPGGAASDIVGAAWTGTAPVNTTRNVAGGDFSLYQVASIQIIDSYSGNIGTSGATFSKTITVTTQDAPSGVPEPSTFVMLGTALTALGALARRRKA